MGNIFTLGSKNNVRKEKNALPEEAILKAIKKLENGESAYVTEEEFGSREVAQAWNQMIDSLCNNRGKCVLHLGKVNDVLLDLTRMDFAKDLINDIREQTRSFEEMAASSEEMAASINEIAGHAQSVASSADAADRVSMEGEENITQAFNFVENAFSEIETVNKQMEVVMDKTYQINAIVDIVKEIADQTNLLALNAAIEAARAGEQGRGFAVVAEEVRNLAENTKQSVADIQENISQLEKEIQNSGTKTKETSDRLNDGKMLVDEALQSIKSITAEVREVSGAVTQISANAQEQNAVSENFTEDINKVSGFAERLLNEADQTGRAIFEVSKLCNGLKLNILNDGAQLSTKDLLDVCKTDHLMWRWRIYNMILGYETVDTDKIGTHHDCRLGKWYYSEEADQFKKTQLYKEMEGPHAELHKLAKEASLAYKGRDIKTAEKALEEMDKCSDNILRSLDEMKAML
ncbi:methyl-accepting chemotaxis protein [Metallumcola ferriviriculae]|uniref:Methyl-accepting chemotaxis protein n=1 Tax=Metallumcola ferriviriculae TaxID=3039180 RepID=A0AAU0UMZ2_9FIRM|nr:methyl-accepting chemotaxis protein [Desulfitibacteraceae bacterium MK1]